MAHVSTRGLTPNFLEQAAEDKGACVVVGAVAFMEVGHVEDCVLKDACGIAHPHDVIEPQRW